MHYSRRRSLELNHSEFNLNSKASPALSISIYNLSALNPYKTPFTFTYDIQLWGTASISTIEILERFQSKALCLIADTPWYVANTLIRRNLQIPSVKEEISHYECISTACK
jgi:hypothetical protein